MPTLIPEFKCTGKCVGGDEQRFVQPKMQVPKELYENVKNFGTAFQRKKLKNTSQLCQ